MKARRLLKVLTRPPRSYRVVRQRGSHRRLESSAGYPPLTFAWHDGVTVAPGTVRDILVNDVGLQVEDALKLL
jgi:predicted RNA binding protein YcfA (HicA-like mRNA interferase family)